MSALDSLLAILGPAVSRGDAQRLLDTAGTIEEAVTLHFSQGAHHQTPVEQLRQIVGRCCCGRAGNFRSTPKRIIRALRSYKINDGIKHRRRHRRPRAKMLAKAARRCLLAAMAARAQPAASLRSSSSAPAAGPSAPPPAGEEPNPLSFLAFNSREPKPRTQGLTEARGPYYSPLGRRQLADLLETCGAHVDALKVRWPGSNSTRAAGRWMGRACAIA
jgi:hypothetical protein